MKSRRFLSAAVAAIVLLTPLPARSQGNTQPSPPDPLAPFERLMGGQWHLDGSFQEFEWGVGKRSAKARSYFIVDGKPRLVAEGVWFWHPGEKQIKGTVTAIDMPVVFFDYTTRFEGDRMVSELRSYGPKGNRTDYVETWDFTDEARFIWKLLRKTPDGLKEEMGGIYTRR